MRVGDLEYEVVPGVKSIRAPSIDNPLRERHLFASLIQTEFSFDEHFFDASVLDTLPRRRVWIRKEGGVAGSVTSGIIAGFTTDKDADTPTALLELAECDSWPLYTVARRIS